MVEESNGYSLVFEGGVMPGFSRRDVIEHVARRLGRDAENIRRLFQDKPIIVRKGLDREKAFRQQKVFAKMGVSCRVDSSGEQNESSFGSDSESCHTLCPKCGNDLTKFVTPVDDCPYCGIIISKYLKMCQQNSLRA